MPYYFYKAVLDCHITGKIPFLPTTGIKKGGLDPSQRNAFGGATMTAVATTGRALSESDKTGRGQCLTGDQEYAEDYATTDKHRLLRITLGDGDLAKLVQRTDLMTAFASMQEAVDANECSAIVTIPPESIHYLADNDSWQAISTYPNPEPKSYGD
ncbi:hypothetical protein ACPA5B_28830 [Pseudomonas solani]|uniref:hypothetical protein n=1 Tax=Pseudomonas solani TaxID=2731552 RepID=UPI003C2D23E2